MTLEPSKIWGALRESFEPNDGDLPEASIHHLTRKEVIGLYEYLIELAGMATDPKIYNLEGDKSWRLSTLKDPVRLVMDDKVQGFWVQLKPFEFGGQPMPDFSIGLFDDDHVLLVYSTGPWWDGDRLIGYFDFLIHLLARTQNGTVDEFPEFNKLFETYRAEKAQAN